MLDDSGIVRHDIRRSFGSRRTLAKGVPLRVNLTVTDASDDYAPMAGAAVYLWHCDRAGRYSMYSSGVEDENYLRGIAKTDRDGTAWFKTIFPGCYSGRWPHIHFEVYSSVAKAVASGPIVKTSQLALPQAVSQAGLRDERLHGQPEQPRAAARCRPTTSSATTRRSTSSRPSPAASRKGYVANLTIGV